MGGQDLKAGMAAIRLDDNHPVIFEKKSDRLSNQRVIIDNQNDFTIHQKLGLSVGIVMLKSGKCYIHGEGALSKQFFTLI